ncbi:MAG: hypothetical protein J2P37_14135, partial [Ktedonobacteraceae bacterium]|nr:hypothetical protein [Ktedonobacteraceae bacterium]
MPGEIRNLRVDGETGWPGEIRNLRVDGETGWPPIKREIVSGDLRRLVGFSRAVDQLQMPTIPSHRELITILSFQDTDRTPKNHLDAVIVPTSRVPTNLHEAARVAHLAQS